MNADAWSKYDHEDQALYAEFNGIGQTTMDYEGSFADYEDPDDYRVMKTIAGWRL